MEISKLFEKASSLFDTAHEKCSKSGIDISSLTMIVSENDVIFHGVNWKRLKDDFTEEETCSEYEALIKMILSGETKLKAIITLNNKKETVKPCLKCAELILSLNIENKKCNVVTGKKSQITLSSCDKEIDKIIEKIEAEIAAANPPEEIVAISEASVAVSDTNSDEPEKAETNTTEENKKAEESNDIITPAPAETAAAQITNDNIESTPAETVTAQITNNSIEPVPADTVTAAESTDTPVVKAESFDMESIDVTNSEVLTSAAEDKQAHNNDNNTFAMEEINKENAPAPVDSIPVKSHNETQQSIQMADINDPEVPENTNSESNPVSHLGIDNSGLKMIFDDWEAIDVSEKSDDSISSKPFNINSLNNLESENSQDKNTESPAPAQPDTNQPMNSMYQQQPMNGMYQQQPMNGMYQQQPMNGMYQQQPMNSMYQQQPMNSMYQQQPMNGMYQQQPMNSMYQRQSINVPGSLYMNQMPQTQSVSVSNYQNPYTSNMQNSSNVMSMNSNQSMSVYGTNINTSDNNAIFKDRLNNILNSSSKPNSSVSEEQQYEDAIQSAKDRKKAAKIDAKFLKKQKRNGNL